jgi:hypothetical protein
MAGAPTLNNVAGSLNAVLRACLITGFNVRTVDSIVVSGAVATVTVSTGHGFGAVAEYVQIDGSPVAAAGGVKKVTSVANAQTFTFAATGIADQTITGSITCRRAPVQNWAEEFTSGNVSVFRSVLPTATGIRLRVDDSVAGAESAVVAAYETMTDANTGAGRFPAVDQFFSKGPNTATAKDWALVADESRLYWCFRTASTPNPAYYVPSFFGDLNSYGLAGDPYRCALFASNANSSGSHSLHVVNNPGFAPNANWRVARNRAGAAGAVRVSSLQGFFEGSSNLPSFMGAGSVYPDPVSSGALVYAPLLVREGGTAETNPYRGAMPGLLQPLSRVGSSLAALDFLQMEDVATYPSGLLHLASAATNSGAVAHSGGSAATGSFLFDLDNAW